jgi:PAS domain S-box-containing protein
MKATQTNKFSSNLTKSDLRKNEELLSLSMCGTNDGVWDWNLITDEVYYSSRWKSILGYKEDELENHYNTLERLIDTNDKDRVLKKVQEYIEGPDKEFEIEISMNHKNGSQVVVLSRGLLVKRESDDKAIRLIGTNIDITDRKKSEIFMKKTNEILEMIALGKPVDEVYDAIALMYESRHPGMRCSLLELEDGKLMHGGAPSMPKEYCDTVHGLKIGPDIGSCGTSTFTGQRVIVENIETDPKWANIKQFALPHGMRCCWSEPIIDSTGKVLGAFGMYYDYPALPNDEELKDLISAGQITSIVMEREQAQKSRYKDQEFLAEQSKLTSMCELIDNIAHQWRQPLSIISAVASNIQINQELGTLKNQSLTGDMNQIMKQTSYLSGVIDEFSKFVQESNEKESISITDVLDTTLNILEQSIRNNHITIIKTFNANKNIQGFSNELTQAFMYIINNSKDAFVNSNVPEIDRCIFIDTQIVDENLMVEIRDTGRGIDENIIDRIFEPYFTTKHKSIGTGLGLSMTHQILTKRHEASVNVSNMEVSYKEKLMKGTSFRIYFN